MRFLINFVTINCIILLGVMTTHSQSPLRKGDITGDGILDGRDALLIMRIVEGLELVLPEEIQIGDVAPIPGTEGRAIGDGKLTKEDAIALLQQAVGLIPPGIFSGDYTYSEPKIHDFSPRSGGPGTVVTIQGDHFVPGAPDENAVYFGEMIAPILEVGPGLIITQVPPGATTNLIMVQTPAGLALSPGEFKVLVPLEGVLEPAGDSDPSEYIVSSGYEERPVNPDGSFVIHTPDRRVSLVSAVPLDESKPIYCSLVIPSVEVTATGKLIPGGMPNLLELAPQSIAEFLVMTNPILFVFKGPELLLKKTLLATYPEFKKLVQVMESRANFVGEDWLSDPNVQEAWKDATNALIEGMPNSTILNLCGDRVKRDAKNTQTNALQNIYHLFPNALTFPSRNVYSSANKAAPVKPMENQFSDSPHIRFVHLDDNDIETSYDREYNSVRNKFNQGLNPVDWIFSINRVDPLGFPKGVKYRDVHDLRLMKPIRTGYSKSTFAPANLWTSKVDISFTVIDEMVSHMKDVIAPSSDKGLPLEDFEEGVYTIRKYSGAWRDRSSAQLDGNEQLDFQSIQQIPDGELQWLRAMGMNLTIVGYDIYSLFPMDMDFLGSSMKGAYINAKKYLTGAATIAGFQSMNCEERMEIGINGFVEGMKGFLDTATKEGIKYASKRGLEQVMSISQKTFWLLTFLDKLSTIGRVGERLAGLNGWMPNPLGMEWALGPTPLETSILVVGTPFDPVIQSASPVQNFGGDTMTITGKKFMPLPKQNQIYFDPSRNVNQISTRKHQAKIISILPQPNGNQKVEIKVPETIRGTGKFYLVAKTDASDHFHKFTSTSISVTGKPVLKSIEPSIGYPGDAVTLKGEDLFYSDKVDYPDVQFGNMTIEEVFVDPGNVFQDKIDLTVPDIEPGEKNVTVKWPRYSVESNPLSFLIPGTPDIRSIEPKEVKGGERVIVKGNDLYEAEIQLKWVEKEEKTVVDDEGNIKEEEVDVTKTAGVDQTRTQQDASNNTELQFTMNGAPPPGTDVEVCAITPSGTSAVVIIKRVTGVTVPETKIPDKGLTIRVSGGHKGLKSDGYISLEEAIAFAIGEADPFDEAWYADEGEEPKEGNRLGYDREAYTPLAHRGRAHHFILTDRESVYRAGTIDMASGWVLEAPPEVSLFIEGATLSDRCRISVGSVTTTVPIVFDQCASAKVIGGTYWFLAGTKVSKNNINGFVIGAGYGNTISNVYIQEAYDGVAIVGGGLNAAGNISASTVETGFYVLDSYGNSVSGTVDDCLTGVRLEGGKKNQVSVKVFDSEIGIDIENEKQTSIMNSTIEYFLATGVLVRGAKELSLSDVMIKDCTEVINLSVPDEMVSGFYLSNIIDSSLSDVRIQNVTINGIILTDQSHHNEFEDVYIKEGKNGWILQNTHSNLFSNIYVGAIDRATDYEGGLLSMSGIKLLDECKENDFFDVTVIHCGEHGILLDGKNVRLNYFEGGRIGSAASGFAVINNKNVPLLKSQGNEKDGVHLRNDAKFNQFENCIISHNRGNGITLKGKDVQSNVFRKCLIGSHWDDMHEASHPPAALRNMEWGLEASDGAIGNYVLQCAFGYNLKGSVLLENLQTPNPMDTQVINLVKNGLGYLGIPFPNDNIHGTNKAVVKETGGIGIMLDRVAGAQISENKIWGHDVGIKIADPKTDNTYWSELSIDHCRETGLWFENTQNHRLSEIDISDSQKQGTDLKRSSGLTFQDCNVHDSQKSGWQIASCSTIHFVESRGNGSLQEHGFHILSSNTINFDNCRANDNVGQGFHVQESSGLKFDKILANNNGGNGVQIENSQDISLINRTQEDMERYYDHSISNNLENGVFISDSQDVHVGKGRKGFPMSRNIKSGILITGQETKNIDLQTNRIVTTTSLEGIRVEAGEDIVIGGQSSGAGNQVIGANGGIYVSEQCSSVRIQNNEIRDCQKEGIVLEGIQKALIAKNVVEYNESHGIVLRNGASSNVMAANNIRRNGEHGIWIDGADSLFNSITQNSITENIGKGIHLANGANQNIQPPVITKIVNRGISIYGRADSPNGSIIEIFADPADQGQYLVGETLLVGEEFAAAAMLINGMKYHATVTDPDGNTSEFGPVIFEEDVADLLVFTSLFNESKEIFLQHPQDGRAFPITNDPADDYDPEFSPGGSHVVFVSERNGNPDIWLMNNDGSGQKPIIANPAADYDPHWSESLEKLVFVSERDGNPDIYMTDIDPEGAAGGILSYSKEPFMKRASRNAGDGIGMHFSTAESGNLEEIQVFIARDAAPLRWEILDWDSKMREPGSEIVAQGETNPDGIGWHTIPVDQSGVPSEFVVAFYFLEDNMPSIGLGVDGVGNRNFIYGSTLDYWLVEPDQHFLIQCKMGSTPPQRLTNHEAADRYPTTSPDGTQIAFASNREGDWDIWVMDANGQNPEQLTDGTGNNTKPAWSPTGSQLLFVSDRDGDHEIYSYEFDDQSIQRRTRQSSDDTDPAWGHKGRKVIFSSDIKTDFELYAMRYGNAISNRQTFTLGDSTQPDAVSSKVEIGGNQAIAKVRKPNRSQDSLYLAQQAAPLHMELSGGKEVVPGESVAIQLSMSQAENLGNLAFGLAYKKGVLELQQVIVQDAMNTGLYAMNPVQFPSYRNGVLFNWINAQGFSGNGGIAELVFQVDALAPNGDFPVSVDGSSAYGIQLESIPLTVQETVITITNSQTPVNSWMLF